MRLVGYTARRRLVDYLWATDNEISLDCVALEVACISPSDTGYFPRASKWVSRARSQPALMRLVWRIAEPGWRAGGAALFHLLECFRFLVHAGKCRLSCSVPPLRNEGGYTLALSSRVGDVVVPPVPAAPVWLTLPWAPIRHLPTGCAAFDMFRLLGASDLLKCWLYSVVATRRLRHRRKSANWTLQSYTAFRWFAVRVALERISGDFLMAEHYDRWAILVDRLVIARRRNVEMPRLTLVQHGEIGGLSPTAWRKNVYARLPRKLRAVTILYAYDQISADIFRTEIMTPGCGRNLQVNYFRPQITLQPRRSRELYVMFVGHPLCEQLHVHLLESLKARKELRILYKPHPKAAMSAGMANQAWTIVSEADEFPEVDLLISYPSTLVTEYAGVGVPSLVHPLHLQVDGAAEFISHLQKRVSSLRDRSQG